MLSGHKKVAIGDLCKFTNGNGFRPPDWSDEGLPIIRIQNLNGSEKFNYFNGVPKQKWIVEAGDLLFAWAGVRGVSFGPKIWPGPRGVLNQHIFRVVPNPDINPYWLYLALRWATVRIEARAHGFKSSLLHVQKDDITNQTVDMPPLSEQRRIAEVVRSWDAAIEKTANLIELRERQHLALTHQLVFGQRRLIDFATGTETKKYRWFDLPSDWGSEPIAKLAREISNRNEDGAATEVLSCSKHDGFVRSLDYFKKQVFSGDLSSYKKVSRGDFGFPSNHVEEGSIGLQNIVDIGIVSPIYTIFRFNPKRVDNAYAFSVLKTSLYRHIFEVSTSASVDRRGSLRWGEFGKIPFPVPTLPEQRAISAVLADNRTLIDRLKGECDAFRRQERGLLEQLLTGKCRVRARPEQEAVG